MSNIDTKPRETWQSIAQRLCDEQEHGKVAELAGDLLDALDEETNRRNPEIERNSRDVQHEPSSVE